MMTQAGFVWRDPRDVLQETTATLRAVFAGRPGPAHRTPRPASHIIPIHWAGMALETCAAAGAHADGLMLYLNTPARYRRAVERFRGAATEAGRDPDRLPVSLLIPTFIHEHLPTDLATAMSALSDALLDDVLLLGPPSRIREGIARLAEAGVDWITLGPQAVAPESLAQQAERMTATLAPR
jgi:alkanesulfonate monooxygenase SsuD/methylene tetrahydromethanopterin reductase-like flavin-dependent oxidoreductase (luciferase family)